eukprot:1189659-Prorocentrum_minimum.AAC.3
MHACEYDMCDDVDERGDIEINTAAVRGGDDIKMCVGRTTPGHDVEAPRWTRKRERNNSLSHSLGLGRVANKVACLVPVRGTEHRADARAGRTPSRPRGPRPQLPSAVLAPQPNRSTGRAKLSVELSIGLQQKADAARGAERCAGLALEAAAAAWLHDAAALLLGSRRRLLRFRPLRLRLLVLRAACCRGRQAGFGQTAGGDPEQTARPC